MRSETISCKFGDVQLLMNRKVNCKVDNIFDNGIPFFCHKSSLLLVPSYSLSMLDVRLNSPYLLSSDSTILCNLFSVNKKVKHYTSVKVLSIWINCWCFLAFITSLDMASTYPLQRLRFYRHQSWKIGIPTLTASLRRKFLEK